MLPVSRSDLAGTIWGVTEHRILQLRNMEHFHFDCLHTLYDPISDYSIIREFLS